MSYWLMKTEPATFSIDDLAKAPKKTTGWDGVRNFQARNMLRDQMKKGDQVFLYYSSTDVPGIAGVMEITKEGYPDPTAFDRKHHHYDPDSDPENPRWYNVDVRAVRKTRLISLAEIRRQKPLAKMVTLRPGNRLSITPVTPAEWKFITEKLV